MEVGQEGGMNPPRTPTAGEHDLYSSVFRLLSGQRLFETNYWYVVCILFFCACVCACLRTFGFPCFFFLPTTIAVSIRLL